jgi:phospholipid/cholesterol/gamma-HCH transport system permease protein
MLQKPVVQALVAPLPLLTVSAELAGVFGGMVMARSQLDTAFIEITRRFGRVTHGSASLIGTGIGIGKVQIFALDIATVGCFQGLRTEGSADSVGRQPAPAPWVCWVRRRTDRSRWPP